MQFPGMNEFTNDGVLSITVFSKKAPWYESHQKPLHYINMEMVLMILMTLPLYEHGDDLGVT